MGGIGLFAIFAVGFIIKGLINGSKRDIGYGCLWGILVVGVLLFAAILAIGYAGM